MFRVILVHGDWHDAQMWNRVFRLLTDRGHVCETPELPGKAIKGEPAADVGLDWYAAACGVRVAVEPDPVVGHSIVGVILSEPGEALHCDTRAPLGAMAGPARIGPMPVRPRADRGDIIPDRWGWLPRTCDRTRHDATVFPDLQEKMPPRSSGTDVEVFDADLSPVLGAPRQAAADVLDRFAQRHGQA